MSIVPIELEIACNPNTPSAHLTKLAANTNDKRVLNSILSNPNTSISTLIEVASQYLESLEALAKNPTIDEKLLEFPLLLECIYIKFKTNYVYIYKWNFSLPEKFLKYTFNSLNPSLRFLVASNPQSSHILLDKLANDPDDDIRKEVASNPNTSIETLKRLSQDKDYWIRIEVAFNERSNEYILETLANDINNEVIAAAAINKNINSKTLKKLMQNQDSDIRWNSILNAKTPLITKLILLPKEFIQNLIIPLR